MKAFTLTTSSQEHVKGRSNSVVLSLLSTVVLASLLTSCGEQSPPVTELSPPEPPEPVIAPEPAPVPPPVAAPQVAAPEATAPPVPTAAGEPAGPAAAPTVSIDWEALNSIETAAGSSNPGDRSGTVAPATATSAAPAIAEPAADPPASSKDYHTVDVYYGTNRKPLETDDANNHYGPDRHRKGPMEYGRTTISIPLHHKIGVVERPKWYKLEFSEDPKKHVTILDLDKLDRDSFFSEVNGKAEERPLNEGLVFIHGFNVPFDDAIRRTGQIAFDLDFGGVTIAYSWPSQGSLTAYTIDEANAEWSIPHLSHFLIDIQEKTGLEKIHVIAHSMGTRVLSYALANAKDEGFDLDLNNVILAAPDIDVDIFKEQILPKITGASDKLTMYASSDDTALKVSQGIHGNARLGLSGSELFVYNGMDTVNASGIDTSMIGHGYYGSHKVVVTDIFNLVIKGLEPLDRKLNLGPLGEWDFDSVFE